MLDQDQILLKYVVIWWKCWAAKEMYLSILLLEFSSEYDYLNFVIISLNMNSNNHYIYSVLLKQAEN